VVPVQVKVSTLLKDSANICTQLGAENTNVDARVSIFAQGSILLSDLDQELEINQKASVANKPYESSNKTSHNNSSQRSKNSEEPSKPSQHM
jgi:hypothetical protein